MLLQPTRQRAHWTFLRQLAKLIGGAIAALWQQRRDMIVLDGLSADGLSDLGLRRSIGHFAPLATYELPVSGMTKSEANLPRVYLPGARRTWARAVVEDRIPSV